jgi:MFS family permease
VTTHRFGPTFPRLFTAAILQEMPFALMIHLPGYLTDLGATESLIGVLYAASAALSLLLRPLMGRMIDLIHRRTVILAGGMINIAIVLLLTTTTVWGPYLWALFLAWRVVQITLFTAMLTYGADSIPLERRTQGLALFGLSGLIPIAIGGYIGDVVIEVSGFDGLFVAAAVIAVVSWLIVWTLPVLPVRGAQPRRSFWAPLVQRNMLPLWFVSLLFAIGIESLFTFTRTFVDDRQIGNARVFFAVYGASAAITRIAGGQLYDRIPHRPLLVSSIAFFGVGLGVMAIANVEPWMYGAAVVMGTAHGASFPLLSSEVVNRSRVSERGSAMTVFTSLFDIALLVGAPAVGFLIDGFDYNVAFSAAGAVIVVGAIFYGFWDRRMVAASAPFAAEEVLE